MNCAVELRNISKFYGALAANHDVSLKVQAGHIHAIVGENGAGKSTAVKILFGLEKADEGELFVFGEKVRFHSPDQAMQKGLGMVHQHFVLCENETALENFLLMRPSQKIFGFISRERELEKAEQLAKKFGFEIPWNKLVRLLSVGEQQRLEILKALSRDSRILILDEPTAVLTPQEISELFSQLRHLKQQGLTILIITHKLKEVLSLCDDITVFQKGKITGSFKSADTSLAQLAEKMVGRPISFEKRALQKQVFNATKKIDFQNLEIKRKNTTQFLKIKDFFVCAGEIVGLAGVEGNGQSELIHFLNRPKDWSIEKGTCLVLDAAWGLQSIQDIQSMQISFFPEDRLKLGAVADFDLAQNFILGYENKPQFQKKSLLGLELMNWPLIKKTTDQILNLDQIEAPSAKAQFASLSGGNQQKVVVARELFHQPQLVIAAQPTRGVDVGAIEMIHEKLIRLQEQGAAILLISSEMDELIKLSDRIYVMSKNQMVDHLPRDQFDASRIGTAMGGGK